MTTNTTTTTKKVSYDSFKINLKKLENFYIDIFQMIDDIILAYYFVF
jgi:hypothetical protein